MSADAAPADPDLPVVTEQRGRVLTITINRPDQRNAVNAAVAQGIAAAVDRLDGDQALSVGVLTGAGKGFCAGMDLKAFVAGERPHVPGRGFAGIVEKPPAKPMIASATPAPPASPSASDPPFQYHSPVSS